MQKYSISLNLIIDTEYGTSFDFEFYIGIEYDISWSLRLTQYDNMSLNLISSETTGIQQSQTAWLVSYVIPLLDDSNSFVVYLDIVHQSEEYLVSLVITVKNYY